MATTSALANLKLTTARKSLHINPIRTMWPSATGPGCWNWLEASLQLRLQAPRS
ncbi:hypothetical protein MCERE1_01656 [Burkholderiaceae bacterium]